MPDVARSLEIPASPEALTPDWLTAALRSSGALRDASVQSFDAETIGVGAGFLGTLSRLTLHFDRAEPSAPKSVIAKMPTLDPGGREIGNLFRFYEREVRFYQEIADRIALRVPRAYHADVVPETGDFILLLEDMTPASCGDQLESCTAEQARLAVHDLAQFQAGWWEHKDLDTLGWMPYINDDINKSAEQSYQQCWEPFVERFREDLPDHVKATGERLGTNIINLLDLLATRPRTIVHGDYRLDNLFFASPQGGAPLAVIDWQIANRAVGVFDLGYFVSGNIDIETRRAKGDEFVKLYHDTLVAGGVKGYTFDECMLDYRASTLFCLAYVVISVGSLDPANDRGLALLQAWCERVSAAITDLDAAELLPA